MNIFPNISRDLLDYFDKLNPDRCPDPKATDREIWMATGRRQVVEQMIDLRKDQEAGAVEGLQSNVLRQLSTSGGAPTGTDPDAGPASATAARSPASPGNRLGGFGEFDPQE